MLSAIGAGREAWVLLSLFCSINVAVGRVKRV
jgi:hypothetical protein